MARRRPSTAVTRRVVLAAIARREWLLQMLAVAAAAGCGRGYDRRSTVILAYDKGELMPDADLLGPQLFFLPLVQYDANGNLQGRLAQSWEHSADFREWTFQLRDARWHDGVPVTAHDVKFTLELLMHPDLLEEGPGTWDTPVVLDDRTIRIRSNYYGHNKWTRILYYPRHLLKDLPPKTLYDSEFWMHPVGNGPYRFVRYVPDTMMELEANPDYYGGKPRIARVVLKFSLNAGITQLLSGDVDAMTLSDRAQIRSLTDDPRFRIHHWYRGERTRAIYWNTGHPTFRDVRVRRALTLAINRRELRQLLDMPPDIPIVDGFYTERQLFRGDLPEPLPHDPAQARVLLDAAGWRDGDDDGVREQEGRPFRFAVLLGEEDLTIAIYMQDQLRRVGVQVDIQPVPPGSLGGRINKGAFEAAIFQMWRPPTGYRNPEFAGLMQQAEETADPDVVDRLRRRGTEIFQRDVPVTMLFPFIYTVVSRRRIQGLASPFRADPAGFMENLWIEE